MSFDHRVPGTPASAWRDAIAALPVAPAPGRGDHLLVLAAHPDDETLGAGGMIAAAARRGAQVTVVVATHGEGSHPDSPTHTPQRLAAIRRRELREALTVLAPDAAVDHLDLPDGGLSERVEKLVVALGQWVPGCTHLVTPWRADGHPDHEACADAGRIVASRHGLVHWQYPIWAWHWGDAGSGDLLRDAVRVPLDDDVRTVKARALDRHESQNRPLSPAPEDGAVLEPFVLEHFTGTDEVFVLERRDTPVGYFEQLYDEADDPWGLESRFYERRKRAALLAALPRERFRRAFEPGCANGALTAELALRCGSVVATDAVAATVARTTERFGHVPSVSVRLGVIPEEWPDGQFDLIVLSEVGYYCADLRKLASRVGSSLTDDGVLVACHWRHPAPAHPYSAPDVHAALGAGLRPVVEHTEADFLLHVWNRSGESVAAAEGIVP
ncbi:bifunctional PIG-L family deacetylase/class I SAM-dependent methyltransferase [Jatrophihabitans fulvus]